MVEAVVLVAVEEVTWAVDADVAELAVGDVALLVAEDVVLAVPDEARFIILLAAPAD